jgi:hypothetical protein
MPGVPHFGPNGAKPPDHARFVLPALDASSGKMVDSFTYLAQSGAVLAVERAPARFDPRARPWYRGAWRRPGLFISDAYVFFSSQRPGLTLSTRIATGDGAAIGAVGADISLETLADFLMRERVGMHGVTFVAAVIISSAIRGRTRCCAGPTTASPWRRRTKSAIRSWHGR